MLAYEGRGLFGTHRPNPVAVASSLPALATRTAPMASNSWETARPMHMAHVMAHNA
jgi:hypothetical protein